MPALDSKLRSQLDDVCQTARDLAVAYAQSALQKRAVDAVEPLSHFGPKEKELRNRLRARGRQVGDVRNADGTQAIDQLAQELAYEYWHRMLFARFLAENNLLMHPDGVAVSLEECDELAPTADPPAVNGFVLAARYASTMLPQIFRTDDVLLEIEFAPEQRLALEKELAKLPKQTFEADDSLGWVYQFWQTAEKKRVNESGNKIDGRTLPAVTQLFTEHYMVEFLLHNTIGAWWCAKEGIQGPPGGAGSPAGKSPVEMPYLRWRDDGTPAAGKFEGWPKTLAEFKMLDPCCGSGHFLVAAFNLLVPLRIHEEGLTVEKACEAVLRDNIFGLELDPRCTQIAAFALALAAWKYPDAGSYRPLPPLNIACSGTSISGKQNEWIALVGAAKHLGTAMFRLFDLFANAAELGSLIDPAERETGLKSPFVELRPFLEAALSSEDIRSNPETLALGVSAQGIAKAASLLAGKYSLIATNVPYLTAKKYSSFLQSFIDDYYSAAKNDLANVMLLRCLSFADDEGSVAIVAPQNFMFLSRSSELRRTLLHDYRINVIARLGEGAFQSPQAAGAFPALYILTNSTPAASDAFLGIDCTGAGCHDVKDLELRTKELGFSIQLQQAKNADLRITFGKTVSLPLLETFAVLPQGIKTGDDDRWKRCLWELQKPGNGWQYYQSTVDERQEFGGRHLLIDWRTKGAGMIRPRTANSAVGRQGVAVSQMRELHPTLYTGERYDSNVAAIVPNDPKHLPALWSFCSSEEYHDLVREIDPKIGVTNATLGKIPFDVDRWMLIAAAEYPNGLPQPYSDDPTQWLFKGSISASTDPLQVAVARLLGYRWPDQPSTVDEIDNLADNDGILCLPGVRGEATAAERMLEVLHAAYGKNWSDSVLHKLLTEAGCKAGTTLEDWLRNQFFEQHCKRFEARPFVWHVWDGRKDGFSALVNYHMLTEKALESLTYSYLGDWITAQGKSDKAGADLRLGAAQELQTKLKLILEGEPPCDIFVRWKPLYDQAIGWNPDLNDGVRMNIRPFMEAGILRKNPNIKWNKDRGKEPERDKSDYPWFWNGKEFVGDRVNDVHLTNAEKQAARSRKKGAK